MDAAVTTLKFESKAVIPTDPRTKLFLTVTVSTIMITGGTGGFMNLVRPCLMACPIVFLLLSRKWVAAARFAITYAILFVLELTVLPLLTGTWNFILGAAVGIYTHMLPGFIMGYYLVSTTTVSEFVAAMERMHVPEKIVIPVSVVFRFFPTVKRGICGYTGCHEDARHHYSPQSHEDAGIPGGSSDDVDCQNRRRTVCGGSHARAWSAAETDKYLQNWLWAFGHFLLPAGDTLLGRFLYLLGGRSL